MLKNNKILQIKNLNGFYMIHDFITQEEHDFYYEKLKMNNKNVCNQVHTATEYGWKFIPVCDNCRNIIKRTNDDRLEYSDWAMDLNNMIVNRINIFKNTILNICNFKPNHMLINKYEIGDGCNPHVDDISFWTDIVIGVSFGSSTVMNFTRPNNSEINVYIPKCSVYILSDDARYKWTHSIPFTSTDCVYGVDMSRNHRISVTLRQIKQEHLPE